MSQNHIHIPTYRNISKKYTIPKIFYTSLKNDTVHIQYHSVYYFNKNNIFFLCNINS